MWVQDLTYFLKRYGAYDYDNLSIIDCYLISMYSMNYQLKVICVWKLVYISE